MKDVQATRENSGKAEVFDEDILEDSFLRGMLGPTPKVSWEGEILRKLLAGRFLPRRDEVFHYFLREKTFIYFSPEKLVII